MLGIMEYDFLLYKRSGQESMKDSMPTFDILLASVSCESQTMFIWEYMLVRVKAYSG